MHPAPLLLNISHRSLYYTTTLYYVLLLLLLSISPTISRNETQFRRDSSRTVVRGTEGGTQSRRRRGRSGRERPTPRRRRRPCAGAAHHHRVSRARGGQSPPTAWRNPRPAWREKMGTAASVDGLSLSLSLAALIHRQNSLSHRAGTRKN